MDGRRYWAASRPWRTRYPVRLTSASGAPRAGPISSEPDGIGETHPNSGMVDFDAAGSEPTSSQKPITTDSASFSAQFLRNSIFVKVYGAASYQSSGAVPPHNFGDTHSLLAVNQYVYGKQRLKCTGDNLPKPFTDDANDGGGLLRAITFYSRPKRPFTKFR